MNGASVRGKGGGLDWIGLDWIWVGSVWDLQVGMPVLTGQPEAATGEDLSGTTNRRLVTANRCQCCVKNHLRAAPLSCTAVPRHPFESCSNCEVQHSYILALLQTISPVFGPAGGQP